MITAEFREFFRQLGRAMRVTVRTGDGGVVRLFVVYGYEGAEEDSEKHSPADKLLSAVLEKAQVVCVGQRMIVVEDFNAAPGVVPCLAKVLVLAGWLTWRLPTRLVLGLSLTLRENLNWMSVQVLGVILLSPVLD